LIDDNLEALLKSKDNQKKAIVKRYDFLDQCGIAYVHGRNERSFRASDCHQGMTPIFFEKADLISFGSENSDEIKNITLLQRAT
jgi:hypothetical protein